MRGGFRSPLSTLQRPPDETRGPWVIWYVLAQQLEVAQHRHQKIVEVVGNAASQLSDHLHFLGLSELLFRSFSIRYFGKHAGVRLPQFSGPRRDTFLKHLVELRQAFPGSSCGRLCLTLPRPDAGGGTPCRIPGRALMSAQ